MPRTSKPKNVEKDKRSWWLSHEAFLYFEALAKQRGIPTSAFLEDLSRDLALERLPDEQRASIIAEAQRITHARKEAMQHAQATT